MPLRRVEYDENDTAPLEGLAIGMQAPHGQATHKAVVIEATVVTPSSTSLAVQLSRR